MIANFAVVSGTSAAVLLVVHSVTFAIGHRIGRYNVVDVAWGLGFIAIAGWWSLTTVLSPLLMSYFLVYVTGARLTEKYMAGRPGFDEYKARTSFFVPRPPRSAQNDDCRR